MVRPLVVMLATGLLAACTPLAGSPAVSAEAAPTAAAVASPRGPDIAGVNGCPVTVPTTSEHPKNGNTAAFTTAWYVSPDRRLWASAGYRYFEGGNKVLWERAGSRVDISGKLLSGDTKAAGIPTISGPQGYEGMDYQASGVTFPVPGCWEVEARADTSVLDFVTYVYPTEYQPAAARTGCIDLRRIYDGSLAVLTATVTAVDDDLPGFARVSFLPKTSWKMPQDGLGRFELHLDLEVYAPARASETYVLFLSHQPGRSWQIVCPFFTLATIDEGGTVHPTAIRAGSRRYLPADAAGLDREVRALAE